MYQSRQPAVSEDKFFELLQEDQDKKAFFHYLWETLGPEGQKWLSHRVLKNRTELPEGNVAFARMIGAREVTLEEKRALELNSLINHFSFRKILLSSSFSAQEAAELLGVSRQTIHERIRNVICIFRLTNHQSCRASQVSTNCCEVERSNSCPESLFMNQK